MKKIKKVLFNYLSLFGEEPKPKELSPQEMASKIDELEGKLTSIQKERDDAIKQRDDLQKQVNGLRITGLTQKVDANGVQPKEEQVTFDFDL